MHSSKASGTKLARLDRAAAAGRRMLRAWGEDGAPGAPLSLAQLRKVGHINTPGVPQKHPASPNTPRNPFPGRFSQSNTSGGRLISTLMAVLSSPSPWSRAGDAPWRYPRAGLISPIILLMGSQVARYLLDTGFPVDTRKRGKKSQTNPNQPSWG